jgi:hypothetical protein
MMQRLEAAQAQYDAAVGAFTDLALITSLGSALVALQLESAQLPLSEEDYLTLADRRAALVQRGLKLCRDLSQTQQVENLATASTKVQSLIALECPVGALTGTQGLQT